VQSINPHVKKSFKHHSTGVWETRAQPQRFPQNLHFRLGKTPQTENVETAHIHTLHQICLKRFYFMKNLTLKSRWIPTQYTSSGVIYTCVLVSIHIKLSVVLYHTLSMSWCNYFLTLATRNDDPLCNTVLYSNFNTKDAYSHKLSQHIHISDTHSFDAI
jgi:hypothetical protein